MKHSYSFSEEGHMIVTNQLFHAIFDVEMLPLRERMKRAQIIYYKVQSSAIQYPNHKGLKSLHLLAHRQYTSVVNKFQEIEKHFTRSHHSTIMTPTTVNVVSSVTQKPGFDANSNALIDDPDMIRKKRFAQFLLGLFGGAFTATIFGILNGQKLESLNSQLQATNSRQASLIHIMQKSLLQQQRQNTAITDLENLTSQLTSLLAEQEANINLIEISLVLQHTLHTCEEFMDRYLAIIHAATTSHRLAYGVISYKEGTHLISQLTKKARKQHMHLAITSPAHLLQVEVTILFLDDGLRLALHIPAYKGQFFKLFKYHPSAMKLNDLYVFVKPEKNFLAIDNQDDTFIELDQASLSTCNKIHSLFICDHITVVSKPSKKSCLNSLFQSKANEVAQFCQLQIKPAQDEVVSLSKNAYISYTKEPVSVKMICSNSSTFNYQLNHLQRFNVDPNCMVELPNYKVYGIQDSEVSANVRDFIWPLNTTDLLPSLDLAKVNALFAASKNVSLPPFDPHQLKAIQDLEKQSKQSGYHTIGFFTVLGISFFSLLIAFLVLLLIYCAYKKRKAGMYNNVPKNPDYLMAHYNNKRVKFPQNGMCGDDPCSIPPPHNLMTQSQGPPS